MYSKRLRYSDDIGLNESTEQSYFGLLVSIDRSHNLRVPRLRLSQTAKVCPAPFGREPGTVTPRLPPVIDRTTTQQLQSAVITTCQSARLPMTRTRSNVSLTDFATFSSHGCDIA